MLNRVNFYHARLQKLYEREISIILKKIVPQKEFPFFSVSYCELSSQKENLKVYLLFVADEKNQKYLEIINQSYLSVVKRHLAKSKKFAYLPKINFLLDQKLKKIDELEKVLQNLE